MESDDRIDQSLVAKVQSGDMSAFEELMGKYKRPIVNFVYRMIADAEDADEIAQDVFVRCYHNIEWYRPRHGKGGTTVRFSTWLFALAHNATVDRIRWRKRHPVDPYAHPNETTEPTEDETESGGEEQPISEQGDPSAKSSHAAPPASERGVVEEVAGHEIGEHIAAAIAKLPEDQRTVIVLAEYHGMSYAEIAQVMKHSEKSVEAHLYRARQTLRRELQFLHPEISGDAQP